MKKKSQVTVFIIIAIIILIAIGLFIYFRASFYEILIEPVIEVTTEAPIQIQPARVYVDSCIEQVAKDGLILLGQQGGYINPIEPAQRDPTESSYLSFTENLRIPYWFYLRDNNRCEGICNFDSERPLLHGPRFSIETQLSNYIRDNLKTCINDFEDLRQQGIEVEELRAPSVVVKITEDDVTITADYPLRVVIGGIPEDAHTFFITLPVDIKDIYELATDLSNQEAEYKFLERNTLNLITGFSAKDEDKLPPMSEVDIQFGSTKTWQKSEVEQNLKNIIASYTPLLQLENSYNYRPLAFPGDELLQSIYNQGMLIPSNKTYDLEVYFDYLGWDPYFDLNCDGEVCQPQSASFGIIVPFGIQTYNFVYDLSYPVMVTLHDPYAFNSQGYDFKFMLEANIRNNEPMKEVFRPLSAIQYTDSTLLCDFEKRNSGNITINLVDGSTNEPLDALITYTCADESCYIGNTKEGSYSSPFPVCFNGILTAAKEDYLSTSRFLTTELDKPDSVNIELEPLRSKIFKIEKKKLVKTPQGWTFLNTPINLDRNETALVTLTRINDRYSQEHSVIEEYSGGIGELQLAPGTYEIGISLFLNERLVIPEREETAGELFFEEEYTIPAVEFNETFPNGGLKLNYTFTESDLENDRIIFYVVSPDIAGIPEEERTIEDLEQLNTQEEYSALYAEYLKPTFE